MSTIYGWTSKYSLLYRDLKAEYHGTAPSSTYVYSTSLIDFLSRILRYKNSFKHRIIIRGEQIDGKIIWKEIVAKLPDSYHRQSLASLLRSLF